MPYGTIKIDTITFTDAGVDKSIAVSGLVQNPTFTGNVTATGTISGATVRATTVSGVTVSGTTANFASGVFTTQISGAIYVAPAGTAGAPSVQVGTGASIAPGLYSPATDQLGISTGGSFRLVVDSTGRVGIGTSSPQLKLDIATTGTYGVIYQPALNLRNTSGGGTVTNPTGLGAINWSVDGSYDVANIEAVRETPIAGTLSSLVFRTNGTNVSTGAGTERMRIDSSGRVGIGTSSPLTKLDVRSGVITAGSDSSPSGTEILRGYYSATDGALAVIGTEYSSGGIVIGSAVKPSTSSAGAFFSSTNINIGRGAYTIAGNVHKWYIGSAQTVAENSSVSTSEVMRIDSVGRVGIGTPSDGSKLLVYGEGTTANTLSVINPSATNGAVLYFGDSNQSSAIKTIPSGGTHSLGFFVAGANTERMRIDSSGRVGIGSTTPNRKLEVSDASADNFIRVNTTGATKSGIEFANGGTAYSQLYFNNIPPYDLSLLQQYTTGSLILGTNSTERARIDSSGNVLVGTSTARANIFDNVPLFQVESAGQAFGSITGNLNNTAGAVLLLSKSRGGVVGGTTIVNNGDEIGQITFSASDGSALRPAAKITGEVDGTPGANDMPGRLVFSTTADGASSPTERMRIGSDGRIFIACTSSPSASVFGTMLSNNLLTEGHKSSVNTTSSNVHWVFFNTNGAVGSISTSGSATAYNTSSDYRLKENIEAVADGITRLKQLNPSRFNFITDPDRTVDGFIAHEVQVVVPEAITGEKDAEDDDGNPIYQGIDQSKLVPLLTAALQEAIAKIETLEAKVAVLESA